MTKNLKPNCATADYIGISGTLFYCGNYEDIAMRCTASRPGYVIINRKKLDLGEVKLVEQSYI